MLYELTSALGDLTVRCLSGGFDMSPPADREKQPANLSDSLHRNLSLYALAAGAAGVQLLALAQPSEAEVVYTSAHVIIGRDQTLVLDLNHDGISDFTIHNRFENVSGYLFFQLKIAPDHDAAVVGNPAASGASALFQGASIGLGGGFSPLPQVMAFRTGPDEAYSYGAWLFVTNRYLGLNFRINGEVHYGWARLSTRSTQRYRIVAELTGYAYETVPGKAIIAGDTGGSPEQSQADPTSEVPQRQEAQMAATLAALSLGAPGLSIWRRPD
jgi:hypothetical protein